MSKHSDRLSLALQAHASGNYAAAEPLYRKVLAHDRRTAEALHGLGLLLVDTGRVDEGETWLVQFSKLFPRRAESWFLLGHARLKSNDLAAAVPHFARAVCVDPVMVQGWNNLACTLQTLGEGQSVERPMRCAATLSPDDVGILNNFAYTLETSGALEEAEDFAQAALKLKPEDLRGRLILGRVLRRRGRTDKAKRILEDLLGMTVPVDIRASALLELGQILDRLEDHAGAFAAIVEGNRFMAQTPQASQINPARYSHWLDKIDAATLDMPPTLPDSGRAPAFFVGFPRSGTTLVEEMLDRHSRLRGSSERSPLNGVTNALGTELYGREDQVERLRRLYWSQVAISPDELFIDKMPLSIVNLPTIGWLFPSAKIIVALRDPRDVVWSCFAQEFALNDTMAHFLTLEGTARLYCRVMRLWRRYESALPFQRFVYRYEDLVQAPKDYAVRLAGYLGVEFEPAMLEARQRRFITTPSRDVAAGTITDRAVGRWRKYREQMAPVLPMLNEFVEAFGYE